MEVLSSTEENQQKVKNTLVAKNSTDLINEQELADLSSEDEVMAQSFDMESGKESERIIDLNKVFYDLKELKPFGDKLWYSYREYVRFGYRAHP